jgi:hypothetical protein
MNKKSIFIFSILVITLASSAFAGDYIWPMKLRPELTSKFCDYRAGHFHGGLDLRTGGRIGVPVYAIDDGYVWRVATSFRGYGKALYIKLKDDKIIVFGHLSDYFNSLDDRIFAAQMKDKKYDQDLYFTPGEFPVKKGQQIALSGESGTGAPHLHFEMRSPLNNPINPLESGYNVTDKIPPEFDYLAIRYYKGDFNPADPYEIEFLPISKSRDGKYYTIADTIMGDDYIALAVAGGDRIDGSGFFYGYYGLSLLVNDSLLFRMKSDSLSYNTTRQLNYVRDLELIRLFAKKTKTDNDLGIFYRLYVPPKSNQYFWPGFYDNSGIIIQDGNPGSVRKITVAAYDEAGNKSELRFYIKTPELDVPKSISYRRNRDTLGVDFVSSIRINKITVEYREAQAKAYKAIKNYLSGQPLSDEQYINHLRLISSTGGNEFRFCFYDSQNHRSPWVYFAETALDNKFEISGSPGNLCVKYRAKYTDQKLEFTSSDQRFVFYMKSDGPNCIRADINDKSISGPLKISIRGGGAIIFDTSLVLNPVYPGNACIIQSPDSNLSISFQTSSAYYPAYVFPSRGIKSSTPAGKGTIFDIQPDIMLVDTPLKLKFDVVKLGLVGKRVAAYGYSYSTGGWNFIGKIEGTKLEASAFGLGKVALLEDNDPPIISSISPSGIIKSRTPLLSCVVRDRISGLALDSGLSMTIDGIWVPAEYDIDGSRFSYKIKSSLKSGQHQLEIKASDNQGNSAVKTIKFIVTAN